MRPRCLDHGKTVSLVISPTHGFPVLESRALISVPVLDNRAFIGVPVVESRTFMGVPELGRTALMCWRVEHLSVFRCGRVEHSWVFPVRNSGAFMGAGHDCMSHTENPLLDVTHCISNINSVFSTLSRGAGHGPRHLPTKSRQS